MAPRDESYAVPVYRFEKESSTDAQLADDDATEYVRVRYDDRHGDPSLRAIHKQGDATDRYRFRITNDTLGWCGYRGDTGSLPVAVQHAVHAFGYGITDLHTLPSRIFDFLEAQAIVGQLSTVEDDFEAFPMTEQRITEARVGMNDLSLALLARAVLSDDEYWTMWDRFIDENTQSDSKTNVDLSSHLWDTILDTELVEMLPDSPLGRLVPAHTKIITRSAGHEDHLFVDLITEFGIQRFQFLQTGPEECVHQKRGESRVPALVVTAVNETDRTVTNTDSVAQADTQVEVAEIATQFCQELQGSSLVPAAAEQVDLNVVQNAYSVARAAALYLKLHDMDSAIVETVESDLCDRLGISDSSEIPTAIIGDLETKFLLSLPADLRDQIWEYLDEHPAHVLPEDESGPDQNFPMHN